MKRMFMLALMAAPLAALPAAAQEPLPQPAPGYGQPGYGQGGVGLVAGWVRQFLGRGPNRQDIANGRAIDAGSLDPLDLLASVVSCDEYFSKRAGSDNRRYIDVLFHDITGHGPTPRQADYWYQRLMNSPPGMDGRNEVAAALLRRYPPPNLTADPGP